MDVRPEPMPAAGVSEDKIAINIGVWTFTLENGRGTVDQPTGDDCEVQFTFAGKRVTMTSPWPATPTAGAWHSAPSVATGRRSFRWEKDIDEELALDNAFFAGGMHKIADAKEPSPFEPSGSQAVLDGVWRLELREEALSAANVPVKENRQNLGVWTFTIRDGLDTVDQPNGPDCRSRFAFSGKRVTLNWSDDGGQDCNGFLSGTYTRTGDTAWMVWDGDASQPDSRFNTAMWSGGLRRIAGG